MRWAGPERAWPGIGKGERPDRGAAARPAWLQAGLRASGAADVHPARPGRLATAGAEGWDAAAPARAVSEDLAESGCAAPPRPEAAGAGRKESFLDVGRAVLPAVRSWLAAEPVDGARKAPPDAARRAPEWAEPEPTAAGGAPPRRGRAALAQRVLQVREPPDAAEPESRAGPPALLPELSARERTERLVRLARQPALRERMAPEAQLPEGPAPQVVLQALPELRVLRQGPLAQRDQGVELLARARDALRHAPGARRAAQPGAAHEPLDAAESVSRVPPGWTAALRPERRAADESAAVCAGEARVAFRRADVPPLRAPRPLPRASTGPPRRGWRPPPPARPRWLLPRLPRCALRTLLPHVGDGRSARRPSRSVASGAAPRHLRRLNWSGSSFRRRRVRGGDPGLHPA